MLCLGELWWGTVCQERLIAKYLERFLMHLIMEYFSNMSKLVWENRLCVCVCVYMFTIIIILRPIKISVKLLLIAWYFILRTPSFNTMFSTVERLGCSFWFSTPWWSACPCCKRTGKNNPGPTRLSLNNLWLPNTDTLQKTMCQVCLAFFPQTFQRYDVWASIRNQYTLTSTTFQNWASLRSEVSKTHWNSNACSGAPVGV